MRSQGATRPKGLTCARRRRSGGWRRAVDAILTAGGTAIAVTLDGSDEQSISSAVAVASQASDGLDGLHVNFANMVDSNPEMAILELPLEGGVSAMRTASACQPLPPILSKAVPRLAVIAGAGEAILSKGR